MSRSLLQPHALRLPSTLRAGLRFTNIGWHTLRNGRTLSTAPPSAAAEPSSSDEQLAGTTPAHRCYAFLHTRQPPSEYPAKHSTPVQRELLCAVSPWGGAVNFAWSASQPQSAPTYSRLSKSKGNTEEGEEGETYHLTAFSNVGGKIEIGAVSLANVEEVGKLLRVHAEVPSTPPPSYNVIHLYVCTHGARDCRCGETGGAVARRISDELEKRQKYHTSDPSKCIQLAEVAHVGGHKYAGNVLVYPHGEWLGNVKPENVSEIIDVVLSRPIRPLHAEEMPICPSHWRGRMGLSKEEQIALFNRFSDN